MSSFFGRLKGTTSPIGTGGVGLPGKKDPHAPQPTSLEKLLTDVGPLRTDGSDKFFGFENFGSTCYCNSIIQCLYYSTPFREQVINFPTRSPPESLERILAGPPSQPPEPVSQPGLRLGAMGILSPTSPAKSKAATSPGGPGQPGQKPEENKDSPEYKKKLAMAAGPVLTMDFENSRAYGMKESLFTSLKDIFEAVIAHRSRIGVVSPQKFLEILRKENEMFRTPMHQDAHEFLNLLLNDVVENVEQFSRRMEEELQRQDRGDSSDPEGGLNEVMGPIMKESILERAGKGNSQGTKWVHDLFEGTLTSETRCLTCENTSQRDEAFLDLSVDLEQHTSVTACLRKFSAEEMLCERNKFHCDKCGGLQEAEKRMKVKRLPRILALHLKRFKYTEDLQRLQKLFHRVVYPYHLRLFNTTDDAEDPDRLYELYAVVVHIGGGPYHGHYVCIIKTHDQGWLLFDDEMVEPVDKSYVRNFFGGEGNLACAYVLFYQETTIEAMQAELEAEGAVTTKSAEHAKDTAPASPVSPKANGNLNGILHAHVPSTPLVEDQDHFVNLDHAVTAPPSTSTPTSPMLFQAPLEPTPTSSAIPFLNRKKSDIHMRKEAERLAKENEKQRRQDEKEAEKRKRKEVELQRQGDDLKAVSAASNASYAAENDRRGINTPTDSPSTLQSEKPPALLPPPPPPPPKENGSALTGSGSFGLHRFRQTSMSLRHKPRLFGSQKDRERNKARRRGSAEQLVDGKDQGAAATGGERLQDLSTPSEAQSTATSSLVVSHLPPERKASPGPTRDKEKDKERFRFGLGKKKSHAGL